MDEVYADVVNSIDWSRIFIAALGVCLDQDHDGLDPPQVCPDSVRVALLQRER